MQAQLNGIDKTTSKIIFTGLDAAGKTSIILSLRREFEKIAILKPTMGLERRSFSFLGNNISEWDLGGQVSYRSSYLRKFEHYFSDTDIAIYVIDAQNKARMKESLSYLYDIIDRFKLLNISPSLYIFMHKSDPALEEVYLGEFYSDIKERIEKEVKYKKIKYYFTTIHDLSTIILIMSEIMLNLYPKAELINESVKSFATETKSQGVVVMDNNSLVIGDYYENDEVKKLLNSILPTFITLDEKLTTEQKELMPDQMRIIKQDKSFILRRLSLDDTTSFYLLVKNENIKLKEDKISALIALLKNFI